MAKNLPEIIKETTKKATEKYEESSKLRTMISLIPYIGSPMDVFISSEGQKIVQKRFEILIQKLQIEMEVIEEKMIDPKYLESEEFFDIMVTAFESTSRTREEEKIVLYAKILKNSVIINERDIEPEEYLKIIQELTLQELVVAKEIYNQQSKEDPESEDSILLWARKMGWDNLPEILSIHSEDLSFLLKRIEKTGLITEITGTYWDYAGGTYVITNAFRKIMEYLK